MRVSGPAAFPRSCGPGLVFNHRRGACLLGLLPGHLAAHRRFAGTALRLRVARGRWRSRWELLLSWLLHLFGLRRLLRASWPRPALPEAVCAARSRSRARPRRRPLRCREAESVDAGRAEPGVGGGLRPASERFAGGDGQVLALTLAAPLLTGGSLLVSCWVGPLATGTEFLAGFSPRPWGQCA